MSSWFFREKTSKYGSGVCALLEKWASVTFPGLFRRERQCRHSWLLLCSFVVCNLSAAVRHCKPSTTTNVYKGGGVVGEKWLCLLPHFPGCEKGLSTGHLWQAGQTVDYRGIITACTSSKNKGYLSNGPRKNTLNTCWDLAIIICVSFRTFFFQY